LQARINELQLNQVATYPTGPDSSTQENEMFGVNINKHDAVLLTMLPSGTSEELRHALKGLVPDVTTATAGTFKTERMLDESALIAYLGRTVPGAAAEFRDQDPKWRERKDMTTKLKTRQELDRFAGLLEEIVQETMPVLQEKLATMMIAQNFSSSFGEAFAISSRFATWVASFFDLWQKMIRYFVNQANMMGFDATLEEMRYHGERLDLFRTTASNRFHMLLKTYTYLRIAHARGYYNEKIAALRLNYQIAGVHDLMSGIESSKGAATPRNTPTPAATPTAAGSNTTNRCPWCNTGRHHGGKNACPFKAVKRAVAIRLASRAEQRNGPFAAAAITVLAEHQTERERENEAE
jgi:hypothetical protein